MIHPALIVSHAGEKGRGVFTQQRIAKGEKIIAFTGWVVPTSELTDDLFALQIGPDLWLCTYGDQVDDCVNHSCEPNAGFVDGAPVLYALRDIAADEEITFDYTTSMMEEDWTLECRCASEKCRETILPWIKMPASYQERMRPFTLHYLREFA